jgi:hypothetical protein
MALPVIGLVLISALALAGFADELRSFFSAAPVTASRAVKPLSKEEILSKMEAASKGLLPGPAMLLVISTPPLQAVRIADPVTPRARRATAARRAR